MKQKPYDEAVLITGGAGFLGSHLCDRIIQTGQTIICVDNFLTGSQDNIAHLIDKPNFSLYEHDITNITTPISAKVAHIYNLACPASPIHYQLNPLETIKTNVLGTIQMLVLADATKARILQASTSEVYGDPDVHPQPESYWGKVNPIGIRSCYDEGKRCAETLFFDYWRNHEVEIKVIRIFNTYGPRMHPKDGRVVSNFIVQALQNQDITIYGSGEQTRSFCYVDDLIDGMISMMHSPKEFVGPVNLGNETECTILELAEMVLRLTKSKSKLIFKKLPGDDPKKRKPNISLAKEKLNWHPKISLKEGITRTIDYFKKILS